MKLMTILTLLVFLGTCSPKEKKEFVPNDRLISFSDKFVMEIDSLLEQDTSFHQAIFSENFFDKTDTIQFTGNEIYISYLGIVNSCGDYAGDIQFKGDSLILDLVNIGDYACTSQTCDRIKFRIKNEENKKYIVKKW
jgi:hypothetical protein